MPRRGSVSAHVRTRTGSSASSALSSSGSGNGSGHGSGGNGNYIPPSAASTAAAGPSSGSSSRYDRVPNDDPEAGDAYYTHSHRDDSKRPGRRSRPSVSVHPDAVPLLRLDGGGGASPSSSSSSPALSPMMTMRGGYGGGRNRAGFSSLHPRHCIAAAWTWTAKTRSRRVLVLVVVAVVVLVHTFADRIADAAYDVQHAFDGVDECRFVSPVEAYHHDLERLRALDASRRRRAGDTRAQHKSSPSSSSSSSSSSTSPDPRNPHHTFSSNGHLLISPQPGAPHPIPQLLQLGEKRWEDLLSRQSRSLRAAVKEYTRRYKRPPPLGFDKWWAFASKNKVILPDEYDGLDRDMAPFRGLRRGEVRRILDELVKQKHTFTVSVDSKGKVGVEIEKSGFKWKGTAPRARDISQLIRSFAKDLPGIGKNGLRAVFSIFDQPQICLPWKARQGLVEAGRKGEHWQGKQHDYPDVRLGDSCSPDSPFHNRTTRSEGKSFVYDSLEAADFCQNPYLAPIHGITIEPHTASSEPQPHTVANPIFTLAKTSLNSDILIPPLEQFFDKVRRDPAWEDKADPRLAWRGLCTGISMMTKDTDWRQSPRFRLHDFANNDSSAAMEYLVPDLGTPDDPRNHPLGYRTESVPASEAAEYFFDMKLAGGPIQCSTSDGTCSDIARSYAFAPRQTAHELYQHKFLFDVDGNGWSGRFRRLMGTNSVVIKSTVFTEWFQPHLVPWFHYIPARVDYSDLGDIMAFFAGSPRDPELGGFDQTAKALGRNGQCFVQRMYRYVDLEAYTFRLLLEYSRLVGEDGEDGAGSMDFDYDEAVHGGGGDGDTGGGGESADGDEDDDLEDDSDERGGGAAA